jgi:hypothetical protein
MRRKAYISLIQPIVTFGLPTWHPTTAENIQKLMIMNKCSGSS